MNILNKTKTYLVGHMQYVDGSSWRQYVKTRLSPMGITVFDPYEKPFIKDVDEGNTVREKLSMYMERGDYDSVQSIMREIRIYDLNLVDRSDFIIAHIIPNVASWGSAEELVTANRSKKPIFLSIEGGKKKCPLWLMGTIPHAYIYNTISDVLDVISNINRGSEPIDMHRWRLLREEYR
jgi:hypothetical protein